MRRWEHSLKVPEGENANLVLGPAWARVCKQVTWMDGMVWEKANTHLEIVKMD